MLAQNQKSDNIKVLTVYTCPKSMEDENAVKYVNKILSMSQWEEYQNIKINKIHCKDQSEFEYHRQEVGGHFIMVNPTDIKLSAFDYHFNMDRDEVAEAVVEMMLHPSKQYVNPFTDRILVMGRGKVGNDICRLLKDNDYFYAQSNRHSLLDADMLTHYDVIVNCNRSDAHMAPMFFNGKVFDLAGNFEKGNIIQDDAHFGEIRMTPINLKVITMGQIGTELVRRIFDRL